MTPEEKAKELHGKFCLFALENPKTRERWARYIALVAVDEIIDSYNYANVEYEDGKFLEYWSQVKEEINKL